MPDAFNPYESDTLLNQYLFFHYGIPEQQFPYKFGGKDGLSFPVRCVQQGVKTVSVTMQCRALDLGCAVGRSTFELARSFQEVIGIDYSHSFIDAANRLKSKGTHLVQVNREGHINEQMEVQVDDDIDRNRVQFEQGDAQTLRNDLGRFDAVLACNLICRLPDPKLLLSRLPDLLFPGGQLFLTTPFTWLEEYTPKANWLGEGAMDSFAMLQHHLEPHFQLEQKLDMPFLIPETARKFQYTIALASRWTRKEP